jgi:hypothetical protein
MRITTAMMILPGALVLGGCDQISSYLPSLGGSRIVEQRCTTANCVAMCAPRETIIAALCAGPPGGPTTTVVVRRNAPNQPDAPWSATCFAANQTLILTCARR